MASWKGSRATFRFSSGTEDVGADLDATDVVFVFEVVVGTGAVPVPAPEVFDIPVPPPLTGATLVSPTFVDPGDAGGRFRSAMAFDEAAIWAAA